MKKISESAYIAQGAVIVGDVTIDDNTSVWYNAVIRGDATTITIGKNCNIQDCCVIHGNEKQTVVLGDNVSLGHGAIVHSAKIGDNVLAGMGSIIMDGAEIGENCLIAAGALVTKGTVVPANSLVMGSPAKVKGPLSPEALEVVTHNSEIYLAFMKKNRDELWDTPVEDILEEVIRELK